MPRLCRMRLASIGHDSARFDDVTLNFTDRQGRPTNSVLWLRNGGGKTSLLSLLFAGVRPGKRDFLGQRADEKIRRIEDYVGARDHGVVVCEWELDTDRGLFDDPAPRYLSGVFYQRKEGEGDGDAGVDRLYFATLVSADEPELTLDGLPLHGDQVEGRTRRTLSGFRRRLRQLDQQYPAQGVFHEDRNQGNFEEELASHGIDPEVFFYQIRMNEREGGVSERFSFAEDEDFVDFLLEMTFERRHALQVHDQLSTFRQEIVERNEQLKPELEYCQGLVARLHKLAGISQERAEVFRETRLARTDLSTLLQWASCRLGELKSRTERLEDRVRESREEAEKARKAADLAHRVACVHHREACRLQLKQAQVEYEWFDAQRVEAKRQKEIWRAAVPLARVWEAQREASHLREVLQSRLKEFAPDLVKLTEAATRFSNALDYDLTAARRTEVSQRAEAARFRERAAKSREEASTAGESAAGDEARAGHLKDLLARAEQEEILLREQGALQAEEVSAADALDRLAEELAEIDLAATEARSSLEETNRQQAETRAACERAQQDRMTIKNEQERAQESWGRAMALRRVLEADATLLRLLQTDRVDVEAAATGAATKATDELRRVTDAILRIGVEAAEDERAVHELGESGLLPPARDVEALLDWLRQRKVVCWSGWEYIEKNVLPDQRRQRIRRLPHIAAGVLVSWADYERLGDLLAPRDDGSAHRSRSPVVVAPVDAIEDQHEVQWMVVGPTSDAHFDKDAGGRELSRLLEQKSSRQKEIEQHQEWQRALADLKHRLQQYQAQYPRGWFSDRRQKLEIIASRLEEADQLVERLAKKRAELEGKAEGTRLQIQTLSNSRSQKERQRDRLEQFDRSFGSHLDAWGSELQLVCERAKESRLRQAALRQEAGDSDGRAQQSSSQAEASGRLASRLDAELSQVKYCETSARKPEAGSIDDLRPRYQLLLADYEGKVNADSLSHLAIAKDQEARKHEQEFRRVMQQIPEITDREVQAELHGLPDGISAQVRQENADLALDEAVRKLGPRKNRLNSVTEEFEDAEKTCDELARSAPLPAISERDSEEAHAAHATAAHKEEQEQVDLATAFEADVAEISAQLTQTAHELENLDKDRQRLEAIGLNHQQQFDRLEAATQSVLAPEPPSRANVKDSTGLAGRIVELEERLRRIQEKHQALDDRRDKAAKDISEWSRPDRFVKLRSSICHRFCEREASSLESKAGLDISQISERVFQIEEKLKEADKHREIVVHVLSDAVDEALGLLGRVSRMSRLPDCLPQAGKQFLKIETKASENPAERRIHIGDLIDELLQRGEVGDGLQLVQKAVRRVARRITVRVLHPDLHRKTDRIAIADMRRLSGGERLTSAILLFCALLRLRQNEGNRRGGSSVLVLDNPIGTASRLSFLEMQREVASAMNVQLIYATAVNDLNAVGALENVIRLRNTRADRRTGRQFIEVDKTADGRAGQLGVARIVFETAPSSMNDGSGIGKEEEVPDDGRSA